MSVQQKKQLINLLPQEEFAGTTLGRILAWILSTFRVIVVITEVVVMGAFLSRFYLDARMNNLNRQIKEQQAIILATAEFERQFRGAQDKIRITNAVLGSQRNVMQDIATVTSLTPLEITLSSYSFSGAEANIRGLTVSEFSISQLMANLKANPAFAKIELSQISTTDTGGEFNFELSMNLKEELELSSAQLEGGVQ